ncbi:hypothetical protein GCM10009706_24590 [Curtobacterium citreum]|uniref:Gram-positive cocci surface proteins LPxTG domain-containing protein n=1 Tax=Curtobacterium citreum TaxID=2036 RepID=A0ABT2HJS8_9MICO|nr:hypothetical protein [Curtobacterium citreum]MCS6523528.1 hypothetical protein [Curtobacterium citreum]TQJ27619.1 hypothetical protein FB462_1481 [Curtobacterium citreum]GGL84946.1 hypothetical protein GCM10009706_24590 [Curtobacterium citreum]
MHRHSCRSTLRRTAALGAAAVVVAVGSSALGVGAVAASAAEPIGLDETTTAPSTTVAGTANSAPDATAEPHAADTTPVDAPDTVAPTATGPTTAGTPAPATTPTLTTTAAQPTAAATPAGSVTVSGTAKRLGTLTAETAGWPAGTTFTYQWLHSFDGGPLVPQSGETTERTFVIGSMEGSLDRYAVRVTGTAPGLEPTTVVSETSAPVDEAPGNRWGFLGVRSLDLRVGTSTSTPLSAFDGDGLVYSATDAPGADGNPFPLPDGLRLDPDGTLSGTPSRAQVVEFWLHTSSSIRPDGGEVSRVELVIAPGDTTSLNAVVRGSGMWLVRSDGSTEYSRSSEVQDGDPATPLRVRDGETVEVDLLTLDRNGDLNSDPRQPTWSSSVDADVLEPRSTGGTPVIDARLVGAGDHRITARLGNLTRTFTVQVGDARTTVATASTTLTQHPTTGSLAYTGVETGAPMGWALGLLAAGGGLLLHRARRRA